MKPETLIKMMNKYKVRTLYVVKKDDKVVVKFKYDPEGVRVTRNEAHQMIRDNKQNIF